VSEESERRSWWGRLSEPRVWVWIVLGAAVVIDLIRVPESQWTARAILSGIDTYQATVSEPLGAAGVRCRFEPTCSHYAEAVIREEGALVGGVRALGRLARCGPWTPAGTIDPP
jgi:putative membrane protein insertion efficiency factor